MLKVIEAFSGIGSQRQALKNIDADFEIVATLEWDINAVYAYDIIHHGPQDFIDFPTLTKNEIIDKLISLGASVDGKKTASKLSLNYYSIEALESILYAFIRNNNLGSITEVTASKLPDDIDIFTYSFPCQNLSACGAWHGYMTGIDKINKNQSNMIWEVGRILKETKYLNKKLPKFMLMENVKNITYKVNKENFEVWKEFLEELGYVNKIFHLDALEFGIPQHRKRAFMVSILSNENESRDDIYDFLENIKFNFKSQQDLSLFLRVDYSNLKYRKEAEASNPNNTKSRKKIYDENDLLFNGHIIDRPFAKTITTKQDRHPNSGVLYYEGLKKGKAKFRYLTPRECFLLMGFPEEAYDMLINNNVEVKKGFKLLTLEKQYKLAGNSIVVNVLEEVFRQLIIYKQMSMAC